MRKKKRGEGTRTRSLWQCCSVAGALLLPRSPLFLAGLTRRRDPVRGVDLVTERVASGSGRVCGTDASTSRYVLRIPPPRIRRGLSLPPAKAARSKAARELVSPFAVLAFCRRRRRRRRRRRCYHQQQIDLRCSRRRRHHYRHHHYPWTTTTTTVTVASSAAADASPLRSIP